MKNNLLFILSILCLSACDKSYICNCGNDQGGFPYKKVYLIAKSDNGAERKCTKIATSGETCTLQ